MSRKKSVSVSENDNIDHAERRGRFQRFMSRDHGHADAVAAEVEQDPVYSMLLEFRRTSHEQQGTPTGSMHNVVVDMQNQQVGTRVHYVTVNGFALLCVAGIWRITCTARCTRLRMTCAGNGTRSGSPSCN